MNEQPQPITRSVQPQLVTDQMVKDYVQSIIAESMVEVLRLHNRSIQERRSFSKYGVDSIVTYHLINVINQKSSLSMQVAVLFDQNTPQKLLQYILREYTETLRAMLQERVLAKEEPATGQEFDHTVTKSLDL